MSKTIKRIWLLEDYDGNNTAYANQMDAFDAAVELIKKDSGDKDEMLETFEELARSFVERANYGVDGFSIDDFLWCYSIPYVEKED